MLRSSADPAGAAGLSRALVWFAPTFPTGAFSFSHGLEWAVEAGDVGDRDSLADWLGSVLRLGGGWSDAVLLAAAYRAAGGDEAELKEVAELALALQPSRERRLESTVQGEAFLRAVETGWPNAAVAVLRGLGAEPVALPVAVGASAAGAGMSLDGSLAAFLTGFCANLVSAAIRLAPIGQSDGLRVLATLEPVIAAVASRAAASTLADLGTSALRADIASMRHETQTTRLFRS
jgi:urease accessory protein